MAEPCRRCQHFPVHGKQNYAAFGLCLHALMRIDCTRWRLWR